MDESDRSSKAKEIFARTVELHEHDREGYVVRACAGDEALHQDVLSLLRRDYQAGNEWSKTLTSKLVEQSNISEPDEAPPYPIGEILGGRYFIQKQLGQGGIGAIYLAEDRRLYSRHVVVKLLLNTSSSNQYLVNKFKHEAESLARIRHPGVVSVIDLGELLNGKPYLVMEFVEGENLTNIIQAGPVDLHRAAVFIRQIAQALTAAHYEGIYHRDLKPDNIMIQRLHDGTEQAKLIDFGIAKVTDPKSAEATQTFNNPCTPLYAAPEQHERGEVSTRSDIYSLGLVAYELLTGQRPFTVDPTSPSWAFELAELRRAGVGTKPKALRKDLPDAAQEEILRALKYEPGERHQQAFEFGERLSRALTGNGQSELSKSTLTALTPDGSIQPAPLLFTPREPDTTPMNNVVDAFEQLWSNATFTDRIRPLLTEDAEKERAQQAEHGRMREAKRGLGARPLRAQYKYRLGDELCLAFDIEQAGYLTLLDQGAEGNVYCLCPSRFAPNTRLEAGRTYLPQKGAPYSAFQLSGETGKEKLLAIISDEPLGLNWSPEEAETPARVLSGDDINLLFARLRHLGDGRWVALASICCSLACDTWATVAGWL